MRRRKTYREQGTGRRATTITNDNNLLGVEQRLGRGIKREGLALLAQLLTKEILTAVDNLPDRVLKPVVVLWEDGVVVKGPVDGVIQQLKVRIRAVSDGSGDGSRERLSTSFGVKTGLGFCSIFSTGDDSVKPMGNANKSTTIVGDINDELFGASLLEVLQTCKEVLLEFSERGGTEAAKSQNASLSLVHVVELGD